MLNLIVEFLAVGVGGFIGSCVRFILTRGFNSVAPNFPYGTLLSNIVAAFLIGFIIGLEQHSMAISVKTKLFLTTGMLGGLSTFSTFSMETVGFFQNGKYFLALGNISLNLFLSLFLVVVGMTVANILCKNS